VVTIRTISTFNKTCNIFINLRRVYEINITVEKPYVLFNSERLGACVRVDVGVRVLQCVTLLIQHVTRHPITICRLSGSIIYFDIS
jgi:hypothetical protein